MPRDLERVVYADRPEEIRARVVATSRAHAAALPGYRHVDQLQMIGKWFDVYRR